VTFVWTLAVPLLLADAGDAVQVVVRSLILILIVIVGLWGVLRLRRWLKEDDVEPGGIGFTLGDLRAMHKRGEITDAEFERARAQMLEGAKAMAAKLPDPLAREGHSRKN
jgi:hypothetical protein